MAGKLYRHYKLVCTACKAEFEDDGFQLECTGKHRPALLRSRYLSQRLECDRKIAGMYRYGCWLPNARRLADPPGSATYQSARLSARLGLPNLWIAFSGYWPERGALLETASFKELEASGVLSRIGTGDFRALVVASAGNTAAAFAQACSKTAEVPRLIVVPESGMERMKFNRPLQPSVKIIGLTGGAAYSDAIRFAGRIGREDGFVCEGGVKNIGRRDGLGTAMLKAVETIGKLPDFYFQAVGSGAGAIAAHEAALRVVQDSRFGGVPPRLMLSQNIPFTPIYDSWQTKRREWIEVDPHSARHAARKIVAKVLSNAYPPYSVAGGLFEVLTESNGEVFAVSNEEANKAVALFAETEGIGIDPAAGVALASLTNAARSGKFPQDATVLLHITGGGAAKRAAGKSLRQARADLEISLRDLNGAGALARACRLFAERTSARPTCDRGKTANLSPA